MVHRWASLSFRVTHVLFDFSFNGLERKLEAGPMIFLLSSDDASEGWLVLPVATIISLLPMAALILNHVLIGNFTD